MQIQVYNISSESVNHFSQFDAVKFKKILDSILGKVKKIEAQAKWRYSYKKACI